ncbi:MAG: ferritin family protein [candidate division WOR-3 bacterium]|nr:ferritin family protein [candidate division WOR-3 bacterium]
MEKVVEILKTAINIEKNGLIKYIDFAIKTNDLMGKNMFLRLAKDEYLHGEIFEKQLDAILCNRPWVCETIPESIIERIAPKIRETDKTKGEEGMDELSALKTALELEKKSIEFYTESKKYINDPEAIKIFNRIIEMEESHYDLIQAEIDHIERTGFWFGIREFSMEGERG